MQMMYNRVDAENIVLKKDYEKLYDAYYSYDKKILKILEVNENVFWAKDSSAYVIVNDSNIFFSFYKKPKMEGGEYLWFSDSKVIDSNHSGKYYKIGVVDTLKPHQFFLGTMEGWETNMLVSSMISLKSGDYPSSKVITSIDIP